MLIFIEYLEASKRNDRVTSLQETNKENYLKLYED